MKESIEKLKSYFETGDRPTQIEFESLIDSFLHKDDGVAIKSVSVNAEGNIVFAFSDDTEQIITQSSSNLPDGFLENIQNALDKKVDKVAGKQLSAEDFTTLLKTKLEQLENYTHPDFHQISEVENLQGTLDAKIGKADVTAAALHGLEVRDGNGNVLFTADEYVEFEGVSFDPVNKRISSIPLTPLTIYVSSNGDDTTGELGNITRPFQTFLEAYNNIPNDGNLWTLHYIDSGTRDLVAISGKSVRIFTNNTGTFRFLNQTQANLTNVPYFEIDAPRANLVIESASQNSIRPTNFKINVNVLYQRALHQGFVGFWGGDADSSSVNGYIKAKTFRVEVNSIRLFNYHGDFEVDRYVCAASAVRLRNDVTTLTNFKVNEVHSEGFETNLEFLHGQDHLHRIRLYAGTHKINNGLLKILDVTGVTFTCPSFRYSHNGVLTGRMFSNGYGLELDYYNIFNFIGRLTRRGSISRGMNIRKSTIYLDNQLQSIGSHIDLSGQAFVFEDIKIIQSSPTYLFGNIDEAISITQIGYFIGTHNALSGGGSLQGVNINEILKSELSVSSLDSYIDDAAATLGGVLVGQPYINSNTGALHRRLA